MTKVTLQKLDFFYFCLLHFTLLLVFTVPFHWAWVALCAGSYFVRMWAITAGYHRYFSHKAYKTNRVFQFVLAWLGATAGQKGPLWWAARHRHHHKYSDEHQDVHSPKQHGLFQSHVGWVFREDTADTDEKLIPDLIKFPELLFIDRHSLLPTLIYGLTLYMFLGLGGLVWGYFVSTILLYHGTYVINSLCHVWGKKRFVTGDTSRNNFWLALITLGEGWHNNHHHYQHSARQGFYWWEIDVSYYVLRALSWVGLVSKLKLPPKEIIDAGRSRKVSISGAPASANY